MRRRDFLGALGTAASGALAGCASVPGVETPTPGPGQLPAVRVVYRWHGGLSRVARTELTVERGSLGWTTRCRREDATGLDVERDLATASYRRVQRLVVTSDPESWRPEYPCTDVCATDDGMFHLAVTVDGAAYETAIDPGAGRVPAGLSALTDRLDDLKARFRDLEDCQVGDR